MWVIMSPALRWRGEGEATCGSVEVRPLGSCADPCAAPPTRPAAAAELGHTPGSRRLRVFECALPYHLDCIKLSGPRTGTVRGPIQNLMQPCPVAAPYSAIANTVGFFVTLVSGFLRKLAA